MGHDAVQFTGFLLRHGYWFLFFWVLVEQAGIPLPSLPVLLAAGALSITDQISFPAVLLLAVLAATISDCVWYELGRRRGGRILRLLCRISLEPDSCVRNTENLFVRRGASALLVSKFVPGLNTVAQPMAGIVRLSWPKFLAYDLGGSVLWAGGILLAGRIFHHQVQEILDLARRSGLSLLAIAVLAALAWISFKMVQRRRFLHKLQVARISPQELNRELAGSEEIVVVDLRDELSLGDDAVQIPGAIRVTPGELETRHDAIPRDRDVVLYCT
ncbi:MAG TPA: VTT domain-containing protein [Terriglobales bacterium]|nr:VTT domain-containing protein [Terriglobales bacterium]